MAQPSLGLLPKRLVGVLDNGFGVLAVDQAGEVGCGDRDVPVLFGVLGEA
jgi:hypothetical protein